MPEQPRVPDQVNTGVIVANEFFTISTLGTLAGATGATVAVTNGIKTAFNADPRWLGLLVAEVVCLGVLLAGGQAQAQDWFIGILNGFLVFATSAGATAVGAATAGRSAAKQNARSRRAGGTLESTPPPPSRQRFWSSWF